MQSMPDTFAVTDVGSRKAYRLVMQALQGEWIYYKIRQKIRIHKYNENMHKRKQEHMIQMYAYNFMKS